ncbi:MAG TPA: DUF1345 domain-containing protein [Microbacterium sp.]|uniref:DUF1345 domain-containing protein n=1 Tax=Microbacterium sp. TaxID=51671 RepID=UPI002B473C51|nr:DUF1345 domain-containing protein [Microbacterium sp.]HKT56192.1 DUF1345 domain-containing protein [Microbacterium sp.]
MPPMHHRVRVRFLLSLVAGTVGGLLVSVPLGVAAGLVAAWGVLATVNATWVLVLVWGMDAAQTRAHATAEDPGRRTARVIATIGSIASLAAVAVVLIETKNEPVAESLVLAIIALGSVAASWALIQTDYMLRLAHVYYTEPIGGIQFNQDEDPMYTDFAYVSFGVGLAYQIADTNLTRNDMRRVVIAQSLLGYLFGAVILASVINLMAGFA